MPLATADDIRDDGRATARRCLAAARVLGMLLVAGAAAFFATGRTDSGLLLGACGTAAMLSAASGARAALQLAFVGALSVFVWAVAFGLLDVAPYADIPAHGLLPALVVPILHAAMSAWRSGRAPLRLVAAGATALAVLWEVAEAAADALVGTNFSLGARDTATDLLAGVVGIAVAAAILRDRPRTVRAVRS